MNISVGLVHHPIDLVDLISAFRGNHIGSVVSRGSLPQVRSAIGQAH